MAAHNRIITKAGSASDTLTDKRGAICILSRDGRLFGPFASRQAAMMWTAAQEIETFSTYDLLSPLEEPDG